MSINTIQTGDPLAFMDKIIIGHYFIHENNDMLINVIDNYYDDILDILNTTQKELERYPEINDYAFNRQVIQTIKATFFPRYSDFNQIFNKGNYLPNQNFSELDFWPKNEEQRKQLSNKYKPSQELYTQFIKGQHTPPRLKALVEQKVAVSITLEEMNSHMFIVSKTDTGKSTLILELAKGIMDKRKASLVLIEPHGDISLDLAKLCKNPDDLVYIDPYMDNNFSISINIFDIKNVTQDSISIYSSLIVNTFKQIIGSEFSVSMHSLLTPMIAVLLQIPNTSFYDMLRFLNDKENHDLLEYAKNHALIPSHRLFFQNLFSETRFSVTKFSISSKLNILLQDSVFSNLLTGRSTIDLENIINTPGKILIIRLNTIKQIETIRPISRFLISLIVSHAFQRENIPINDRISTHLMIDEGSMFLGDSIELILAQARKFRLYLLIAIQNNSQLSTSIESSILSNTSIKLVGMNSHQNHSKMSKEINVSMDDLFSLKRKGEFFIKVGNNKAYKFRVSNRLFNKSLYCTNAEFKKIQQEQIKKYYRRIDLTDIQYADIPNTQIEHLKPYSKDATQELLSDLKKDDNELLDY